MNHLNEVSAAEMGFAVPDAELLSTKLKNATAALHHEVEHGSEINRRIVTKVSGEGAELEAQREEYRAAYVQFLRAAYGFEDAVQRAVLDFGRTNDLNALGYIREHANAAELIARDLQVLTGGQNVRSAENFPVPRTVAELAGMEYVRRGSRNGNAYIAMAVKKNIGVGAENGAGYLNLDEGQTHPNWAKFKGWLDSLNLGEREQELAVETAMATFRAVGEWHAECCKS
ncbi:MAG: biliverdin-producing heme oxygenase [Calditrichaeota bacterium]|nr:biliverdin-producing heme oxygenase [Calditrichota bacterium]